MIEFGKTLREAREAKGYTVGQVAESTRLMSSMIEDLEKEDFSRIAAPIYGRGFVKLYCEAVGLDPKPLVAEFMEIFSGNRDTTIKERPVESAAPAPEPVSAPVPEPAPVAEPEPVAEPTPVATTSEQPMRQPPAPDSLFDFNSSATIAPTAPAASDPQMMPEPPPAEKPRLTRYSAPLETAIPARASVRMKSFSLPHVPPTVWRSGTLVVGALVIIWGLVLGIRALYRATTGDHRPAQTAQQTTPRKPTDEPSKPMPKAATQKTAQVSRAPQQSIQPTAPAKRTPQKIPPLYMD